MTERGQTSTYWIEQTESQVPVENDWLSPREQDCLEKLRFAKRRGDWRLGRWTAKQALAAHLKLPDGLPSLAAIEILAAASGAPRIFVCRNPAELSISLSHREGKALCVVGPVDTPLGCDLELIEARSPAFVADYFTPGEQMLVDEAPIAEQCQLVSLVWSAKESTLKALQEGLRLDTRSVCVSLAKSEEKQAAGITDLDGWLPFSSVYEGKQKFYGWWRAKDNLVRTIVCSCPVCPPIQLTRCSASSYNSSICAR